MSLFIRYTPISLGGGGGGGGSTLTMGTFDGQAAAAEGATITSSQLFMQSADATHPGLVNLTAQSFAGQKTFTTGLTGTLTGSASLNVLTSALGNLTDAGTDGIVVTGGTGAIVGTVSLAQHVADTTHNGYLSSTDWNTFSGKQATVTIGNFNGTSTAKGLDITSDIISLHAADGTNPGAVSTTTQTFAGQKTFSTGLTGTLTGAASLNVLTSALGNLTDAGTDGIVVTGGTGAIVGTVSLAQHVADSTHNGYLSSTDWSTFNNKQATVSIGNFDTTPNTKGLSLSGAAISLAAADGTNPGGLSAAAQTIGGVKTFSSAPIMSALSASQAVFTDGSKALISNAITGTGNVVMSASPTLTGTITAAAITASGAINLAVLTASQAVVTDGSKNLASLAYTAAATASTLMSRDSSGNTRANNLIEGFTTAATAAGTTTLTVASTQTQQFTGTTTQTVVLPDATTLVAGQCFVILNRSTGIVTVNANGGSLIQTMVGGSQAVITAVTVGTSTGTWDSQYTVAGVVAAVNPTVQKFTSGTAQTYTTPAGVQYIRVRMVGGGGGGGGSGTANGTAATDGGASSFSGSGITLTCNGGTHGVRGNSNGPGGTASITGAIGTAMTGGIGGGGVAQGGTLTAASPATLGGGIGGSSPLFGGGGYGDATTGGGGPAAANTGGGGGGGGAGATNNNNCGAGGGSGGCVDAIINGPAATYTYSIGAAGSAGAAGTSGAAGGAGAAGYIEVTEYYTNFSVGTTSTVTAGTYLGGPYSGAAAAPTFKAFQAPTVQSFTSSSGTYTTPAGVLYMIVEIVGGAGGGGGSGSTNGTAAVDGTSSTFSVHSGSAILTAGPGLKGARNNDGGGGGAATVAAGATKIIAVDGSPGGPSTNQGTSPTTSIMGGWGGASFMGGAGCPGAGGGSATLAGANAKTNSGSGGGGAGAGTTTNLASGGGGGAGAYIKAVVTTPSASYDYSVGTGGAGQAAGTTGAAGGNGAAGYIVVTEYYQ